MSKTLFYVGMSNHVVVLHVKTRTLHIRGHVIYKQMLDNFNVIEIRLNIEPVMVMVYNFKD